MDGDEEQQQQQQRFCELSVFDIELEWMLGNLRKPALYDVNNGWEKSESEDDKLAYTDNVALLQEGNHEYNIYNVVNRQIRSSTTNTFDNNGYLLEHWTITDSLGKTSVLSEELYGDRAKQGHIVEDMLLKEIQHLPPVIDAENCSLFEEADGYFDLHFDLDEPLTFDL